MRFRSDYPTGAPECFFVGNYPAYEHVLGGGFICLSTLYTGWTPIMKASSTAMSIKSMIATAESAVGSGKDIPNGGAPLGNRSPKEIHMTHFGDTRA